MRGVLLPGSADDPRVGQADAAAVLAAHVATVGPLPEASRQRTARLILNTVGAEVAAHDAGGLPGIRRPIQSWGGRPDATVIGTGWRADPALAALLGKVRIVREDALTQLDQVDDMRQVARLVPPDEKK